MVNGVNPNTQSLASLQHLNATNKQLEETQERISSGLKVANAEDNAAVYSIAQSLRGDNSAYDVVQISLDRSKSVGDIALAAGETVSTLLIELRDKALAATDPLDAAARLAYQADFDGIVAQIQQVVGAATFDGVNLLDNSSPSGLEFVADSEGNSTLRMDAQDFRFASTIITVDPATNDLSSEANAQATLTAIQASITNVNGALATLGNDTQKIENHQNFVTRLQDVLTAGIGELVDADLGKESALLTSLQVKQQLGVQAISIANQSPQTILSLFQR
jgi:flagellin